MTSSKGLPCPMPAVVATARAGGTLATVRALGREKIPVTVLSGHRVAAAAWSRFASAVEDVPAESDAGFIDRLCEIARGRPEQVLLPTSDQTAWLYAKHAERLGRRFLTYQPSVDVIESVLDKSRLAELARRADVPTLDTWTPSSAAHVEELAPGLSFPVLIKPRSHIQRANNHKGVLARTSADLVEAYARMVRNENDMQQKAGRDAVAPPILQRFVPMGRDGVRSVSGFIDRSGELFVTRTSAKVALRMYPAGVGVCYESRPRSEELSQAAWRLCRAAGFHGVFEIEFMPSAAGWSVIDFNPRLFSQVGLDIARGMPLPTLLWLAAQGEGDALRQAVQAARDVEPTCGHVSLYDRFTVAAMLAAMTLTSRGPQPERDSLRAWRLAHAPKAVDYAWDRQDLWPGLVHACSELGLGLKALPRFLRRVLPATSYAGAGVGAR